MFEQDQLMQSGIAPHDSIDVFQCSCDLMINILLTILG